MRKVQLQTGAASGLAFAVSEATAVSDGSCSLVLMGDLSAPGEDDLGLTFKEVRAAARAATVPACCAHGSLRCVSTRTDAFSRPATQRVAWQLLDAYTACADASFESMQAQLSAGLAGLGAPGASFAFVLHDRSRHRVVAARDRSGAQTLLWGCARARAPPTSAPWPRVTRQQLLSHRPLRAPRFISQDDAGRLAGVLLHHGLRDQPDHQPAGACAARGRAAQQLPRCSPRYPPAYRFS